MKTFLEEVCENILQQYGDSLNELCLVFPNKRARVFFDRQLQQQLEKTAWAPNYTTINRLMESFSDYQLIDPLKLIFKLYKSYGRYTKSTESFDNFYFWGETLLSDFDDIDKYLVNAHDLFQNLASLKGMEDTFSYLTPEQVTLIKRFWNTFNTSKLSSDQQDFIAVWEVLNGIYNELQEALKKENVGYEGMIYRDVARKMEDGKLNTDQYEKYVFVGFNALNKVEHQLFDYLQKHQKALFYWDYDPAYIDNKFHEAGRFMRENIKLYPAPDDAATPSEGMNKRDKHIRLVAATGETEQARIIPGLLSPWLEGGSTLDRTAIVLADEQLLIPTLYNLPPQVDQVNVTMGYPLGGSPLYKFTEHLLQLIDYTQRHQGKNIHYRLIVPLLTHPFAGYLLDDPGAFHQELIDSNIQYVPLKRLSDHPVFKRLLDGSGQVPLPEQIMRILGHIASQVGKDLSDFELEQLYTVYTLLNRLNEIVKEEQIHLAPKTFQRLLKKLIKNASVSFVGEPLSGLQVMGILETRALDFENLIILSMNEGVYPKSSNVPSFVPYSLRRAFGLPTPEHQDAIYAYYFYRLLQRARHVVCCYNADIINGQGEISRFLKQVRYNEQWHTEIEHVPNTIGINARDHKTIEKDATILAQLKQYTGQDSKYLSPSALNTYLNCSIKFYYRYLLGLKEADEITEEIDALVFGNILHRTIELVYSSFGRQEITADAIEDVLKNEGLIEQYLHQAIQEGYTNSASQRQLQGHDAIIESVIRKYVLQILRVDKQYAPFTIEALEGQYERNVTVERDGEPLEVKIGGKIDRIDSKNGKLRIVDYKTGRVNNSFVDMEEVFWRPDTNRPAAVFQVFLYSYLYAGREKVNLEPNLIFVRETFSSGFASQVFQIENKKRIPVQDYNEVADTFEENLNQALAGLFDPDIPFTQTEEQKHCEHCEFQRFCWR